MSIYQHFRKEEHAFIDQVVEWRGNVLDTYSPKLTDFLDPREQDIVRSVMGKNGDVLVSFFGGGEESERKRALLYPDYYEPAEEDFQIDLYKIEYPVKFVTLEHPQILGSLMSLGMKRGKFGDILTSESEMQLVAAKEVSAYLEMNFKEVGKTKVSLRRKPLSERIIVEETWIEETTTISSLRLDAVLAAIFNLSRQKSSTFIEGGLVKVNFRLVEQGSFECKEGDILSLRKFGRCKILSIDGKTKKDKWRIVVGKQN